MQKLTLTTVFQKSPASSLDFGNDPEWCFGLAFSSKYGSALRMLVRLKIRLRRIGRYSAAVRVSHMAGAITYVLKAEAGMMRTTNGCRELPWLFCGLR